MSVQGGVVMSGATFHVTVNPTDTIDAVARRYRAVFGAEAFERCDEDADRAKDAGMRHRLALLDRAAYRLRHEDRAAGLRDQWGDRL